MNIPAILCLDFGLHTYQPLAMASTLHVLLITAWQSLCLWRGVKAITSNVGLSVSLKMDIMRCSSMLTMSSFDTYCLWVPHWFPCKYWNKISIVFTPNGPVTHCNLQNGWMIYDWVGGMVRLRVKFQQSYQVPTHWAHLQNTHYQQRTFLEYIERYDWDK